MKWMKDGEGVDELREEVRKRTGEVRNPLSSSWHLIDKRSPFTDAMLVLEPLCLRRK